MLYGTHEIRIKLLEHFEDYFKLFFVLEDHDGISGGFVDNHALQVAHALHLVFAFADQSEYVEEHRNQFIHVDHEILVGVEAFRVQDFLKVVRVSEAEEAFNGKVVKSTGQVFKRCGTMSPVFKLNYAQILVIHSILV
eukprot:CAMPEP_0116898060 /NCGR_PEP_ID=MMETSP0467-20121206/6857_1 /TAXON_ID=283647 /ORGANISM="Mesodinium pulex, Strain SPMC105" /LENGTH=137 /DNA_ID=CAMNT_0004569959 /DNA_START=284 /DNA_END=697 /DNA_ORIENTATION=+